MKKSNISIIRPANNFFRGEYSSVAPQSQYWVSRKDVLCLDRASYLAKLVDIIFYALEKLLPLCHANLCTFSKLKVECIIVVTFLAPYCVNKTEGNSSFC